MAGLNDLLTIVAAYFFGQHEAGGKKSASSGKKKPATPAAAPWPQIQPPTVEVVPGAPKKTSMRPGNGEKKVIWTSSPGKKTGPKTPDATWEREERGRAPGKRVAPSGGGGSWKPARNVKGGEVARALQLLKQWKKGAVWPGLYPGRRFQAAKHSGKNAVEVWEQR